MKPPKVGRLAHLIKPDYPASLYYYQRVRDGRLFSHPPAAVAQLDAGEELRAIPRDLVAVPGLVGYSHPATSCAN
jgi:hypothetical protein